MSDPFVFTVGKADPISRSQAALRDSTGGPGGPLETPGAILHITADLRAVRETLPLAIWRAANINIHVEDAQQVCAALAHLPQGTIDQVILLLLEQRASLLRVAQPFPPAPGIPGLPEEPPEIFRKVVAATIEDIRRDDRGETTLPPVTPDGAAHGLWFAVRHLVPSAAREGG